jgi:hypothetical protein
LGSLFVFSPAYADLNAGLVANYSFDDCTAKDVSGNGHDGTINGNPQCVDGAKGKAFSFDGIADFIDLTGKPIAQQGNNPRSIFVWGKTTDQKSYQRVVATGTTGFNQAFNILLWANGQPGIMGYDNDFYIDTVTVADGKWHFIGATYDGNTISIWIDGVLKGSKKMAYNTTGNNNFIGRANDDQTTIETTYFDGSIDDIRVYNRALSETEIKSLYTTPISGTVNGLQKYSAVCKNTKTGVSKKIALADGAKEWNCNAAGLKAKKGESVMVTITGVSQ